MQAGEVRTTRSESTHRLRYTIEIRPGDERLAASKLLDLAAELWATTAAEDVAHLRAEGGATSANGFLPLAEGAILRAVFPNGRR